MSQKSSDTVLMSTVFAGKEKLDGVDSLITDFGLFDEIESNILFVQFWMRYLYM